MNKKELKPTANAVGAFIGRPHFGENTLESPTIYTNSKSKIKTVTSDNKGITLIALVITIIVMLILVAVTVTIALNGGLFSTAKQAKADTQANIDAEQRLASGRIKVDGKWYDSLEDYTKGIESSDQNDGPSKWAQDTEGNIKYEGKDSGIKIGDYVNYTPSTETTNYESSKLGENYTGYNNKNSLTTETLNWRVLGVDTKGCLTLISDKPINEGFYLGGAKGYNNGVYILNDICKTLYSNKDLGVTARSITIEDIEAGFSEAGKTARDDYNKDNSFLYPQYGKTFTFTDAGKLYYPVIYAKENGSGIGIKKEDAETGIKTDGIGQSDPFYTTEDELISKPEGKEIDEASNALTCKQTAYNIEVIEDYCKDVKFHEMIFGIDTGRYSLYNYTLASRCVNFNADMARFSLACVGVSRVYCYYLWDSTSSVTDNVPNVYESLTYIRPVVSLGSNISIQTEGNSGTLDSPYQLEKNAD